MSVPDLIRKFYSSKKASNYDLSRSKNAKWEFENSVILKVLTRLDQDVTSVIDFPVGTGRAIPFVEKFNHLSYKGFDLSEDMLDEARQKFSSKKVSLQKCDLLEGSFEPEADIVLCFRFLNLIDWKTAQVALSNLFLLSKGYLLFTIRTVSKGFDGDLVIDDKIHLHFEDDLVRFISQKGFRIVEVFDFADDREGDYKVLLCQRNDRFISHRINGNGRLVYCYGLDAPQGKIYEAASNSHAEFLRTVSNDTELSVHFPRCREVVGRFVDCDWVNGEAVSEADQSKILDLLLKIQKSNISKDSGFDYVENFLFPRFEKAIPLVGIELFEETTECVRTRSLEFSMRLSHPDLTPANVIIDSGNIIIIDNEFLCKTRYFHIDILNLLYNLRVKVRRAVCESYFSNAGAAELDIYQGETKYLNALWFIRIVGSMLIKGSLRDIYGLKESYLNGLCILPFDFEDL